MSRFGSMGVTSGAVVAVCAAAGVLLTAAMLTSCTTTPPPPPRPLVQQGAVPDDRVSESLGRMLRAPMPVYYKMPLAEALDVLGPPVGELRDMIILRRFGRIEAARAYYWPTRSTTLYLVFDRRDKLVRNLIVVDDATNVGAEVLLTREEILSLRVKPGMSAGQVLKIMGAPDRVESAQAVEGGRVDRLFYDPDDEVAPAVIIEIDRDTLTVIYVSTAPYEELGPPPDTE